jgi:hypothetical protein
MNEQLRYGGTVKKAGNIFNCKSYQVKRISQEVYRTENRGNCKSRNKFLYFFDSEILREIQK